MGLRTDPRHDKVSW